MGTAVRTLELLRLRLRERAIEIIESHRSSVLDGFKPERYDDILIVARESLGDEAHADAASVSTCLTLRSLLPRDGSGPDLTVELLGEENLFLFDDKVVFLATFDK